MNLADIKKILQRLAFQIHCANLEIDAAESGDITRQEAENELKKFYLALQIWSMRLANATNMNIDCDVDADTEDVPVEEFTQLPLF